MMKDTTITLTDIHYTPLIGWGCRQCGRGFLYASQAVSHQENIDENDGICPAAKTKTRHHACYCQDGVFCTAKDDVCDYCSGGRSHCGDVSCVECN